MSEELSEYERQREVARGLVLQVLQQSVMQLVQQGMMPEAVADGLTNTCIEAVGLLNGPGTKAARLLVAGALANLHHQNGHCSPEVAVQALRDLLPELQARIEQSQ